MGRIINDGLLREPPLVDCSRMSRHDAHLYPATNFPIYIQCVCVIVGEKIKFLTMGPLLALGTVFDFLFKNYDVPNGNNEKDITDLKNAEKSFTTYIFEKT